MIDLTAALRDPNLVGSGRGATYARWDAVWKAADGKRLTEAEDRLFREVSGGRSPPREPVHEVVSAVGRRGSKTSEAARILLWRAISRDWRTVMAPGEVALFPFLASTKEQAEVALQYARGLVHSSPVLAKHIVNETQSSFVFDNGAEVSVMSANYRSLRGRSIPAAVLDEVAWWLDGLSVDLPSEAYAALKPSMATFPDRLLILISSVYCTSGLFFERWSDLFGRDDPEGLAILGTSQQFNPTLSDAFIQKEIVRDPSRNRAEYLSEWRSAAESYVERSVVEALVDKGVRERAPMADTVFYGFVDAAGGSGSDAFCLAVSHHQDGKAVLDCLRSRKPRFSPEVVCREFAAVLRHYGITSIESDRWGADFVVEAFGRHGISCRQSAAPKSDLYAELLMALNSQQVVLLDQPTLVTELCALERKPGRGKDVIDHPRGMHDDLANACAGALLPALRPAWDPPPGAFMVADAPVSAQLHGLAAAGITGNEARCEIATPRRPWEKRRGGGRLPHIFIA